MATADDLLKEDALNRGVFANNLCGLIGKLDHGVIAIDGAWGAGKSWLGRLLKAKLDVDSKLKTVWLDAFAADWEDDPALTLLAELLDQLPHDRRVEYIQRVAPLLGKVVTSASKVGLRALGNYIGMDKDVAEEFIKGVQDAEDAYIKSQLEKISERKRSLKALKDLLTNAVQESGGKVVILVDELDRCSPSFAIRFLERIKHLFDIKGAVFVLLWNREQIHQAVRVFYGQQTDGPMYLDRFVDYSFHLPNFHHGNNRGGLGLLIEKQVQRLDGSEQHLLHEESDLLNDMACLLGLSARELKHVCDLWVVSIARQSGAWELWLICLKVKEPGVYAGLRRDQRESHIRARELLIDSANSNGSYQHIYTALAQAHLSSHTKDATGIDEFTRRILGTFVLSDLSTSASRTIARIESIAN